MRKEVYNRCRSRSRKTAKGGGTHELEKQIFAWSIHCSGNDGGDVSSPQRRSAAGRLFGAVSLDGRGVGDFRVALREIEITLGKEEGSFQARR